MNIMFWVLMILMLLLAIALLVFPLLRWVSAREKEANAMPLAFLVLGIALGLMSLGGSLAAMIVCALAFFLAFNLLEAAMPSMVSKLTGASGRGQKMGLYTSFQFLGAFAGGLVGGWLLGFGGEVITLSAGGALCAFWAVARLMWFRSGDNRQQA